MFAAKNLFLTPKTGPAVMSYDATGAGYTSTTTQTTNVNASWTHTASAGAAVVVATGMGSGMNNASFTRACTYGGTAMTSLGVTDAWYTGAGQGWVELFGILSAPGGAQTVNWTVNSSGNSVYNLVANSTSYLNVTSFGTAVTNANAANSMTSNAVTSATGKMIVQAFIAAWGAATSGLSLTSYSATSRYSQVLQNGSWTTGFTMGDSAGASSVTFSETDSLAAAYGSVAVPLN